LDVPVPKSLDFGSTCHL